jgi:hypothetical protein
VSAKLSTFLLAIRRRHKFNNPNEMLLMSKHSFCGGRYGFFNRVHEGRRKIGKVLKLESTFSITSKRLTSLGSFVEDSAAWEIKGFQPQNVKLEIQVMVFVLHQRTS